jgi:hypothetical protein
MAVRPFPPEVPADGDAVSVIDRLTEAFLQEEPEPFAWPETILDALGRLSFRRLRGIDRARTAPCLSEPVLAAMGAPLRSIGLLVASDGDELLFALGGPPASDDALTAAIGAALGTPRPSLVPSVPALLQRRFFGCLSGHPRRPAARPPQGRAGGSAEAGGAEASPEAPETLDTLIDRLQGTPFVYALFATPEPRDGLVEELGRARATAERLDRTVLRVGGPEDVHRNARRARDLMDALARRVEGGLAGGLFRTSCLVGVDDPDALPTALAILAAGLGAPDRPEAVTPLRGHVCSGSRPPDGYSVHHNRLVLAELSALALVPGRERPGFARLRPPRFDVDHPPAATGLVLGEVLDGFRPARRGFGVGLDALCRHAFVAGMTGSGKTTTVKRLLEELAAQRRPFLVLEPAKAEYRALAAAVPDLLVLRVGAPPRAGEIPFVFNPFAFPAGFPLHTHVDYLKQAFVASFGLFPPAPYLLETAIYRVYERRGWNLSTGEHPRRGDRLAFPTLSDLLGEIDPVVAAAGYDHEIARNLRGALKTRIGNLCQGTKGLSLDTRENLPDALLFDNPAVIELKALGSDEEKALVMGLLLTRLYEYRDAGGPPPAGERLRHLLVLEEAHRLVRRTAEKSSEEGNMAHQAVETFANVLAEIRAYGQGVVVVEQLPSKVAPDVVKNSGLKILHRMAPREDRDFVGDTMVLDEEQKRAVATLERGTAAVHADGMDGAVLVAITPPAPTAASRPRSVTATPAGAGPALPPATKARLAALVARLPFVQLLGQPDTVRAGDRGLAAIAAGTTARRALATLGAAFDPGALPSLPGRSAPDVRRELARWALGDALTRRAVHGGASDVDHDGLLASFESDPEAGARAYRAHVARVTPPFRLCTRCAQRCWWRYESEIAAADAPFLTDLSDALRIPDVSAMVAGVRAAAADVIDRYFELGPAKSAGLAYCITREGLRQLGLRHRTADDVLSHV